VTQLIIESQQLADLGTRLPNFLTELVGREREIGSIVNLLAGDETRLLTITGTGGVGKTRVAIEAGSRLQRDYNLTVAWIYLASVDDHLDLEQIIANGLGVHERPGVSPAMSLREAIADDPICLILDNFEQIIDAAPRIVDLLHACPRLKVFVTSRERLRVRGEREFPLDPLTVPESGSGWAIADSPAVSLLVDRARDILPSFQITDKNAQALATICTRLDGLPLALELVAAQLRYMPVNALAERLSAGVRHLESNVRDLPARQQTLAATIDWSYQLLTRQEQRVFRRLSVFRGGFSIEAAEGVSADLSAADPSILVLDCLTSLVEKNLLRQLLDHDGVRPPRFLLLSTIRDFATHELREQGEESIARSRHATWFANELSALWELPNIGWIPGEVLADVEANHQNLRRALDWFEEQEDHTASVRLAGSMVPFWLERAHRTEGLDVVTRVLNTSAGFATPSEIQAAALYGASMLARSHGPLDQAEQFARESLALYHQANRRLGVGAAELALGIILRTKGDLDQARISLENAVNEFAAQNEPLWTYVAWRDLGMLHVWLGEPELADPLLQRALHGFRQAENTWGISVTTMAIARSSMAQLRWDEAGGHLRTCLQLASEMGTPEILTDVLFDIGILAAHGKNRIAALQMLMIVKSESDRLGYRFEHPERELLDRTIDRLHASGAALENELASDFATPITDLSRIEFAQSILASFEQRSNPAIKLAMFPDLTARELEVLELVAQGMSDREIGDHLSISHRTAMRHVANMLPKLGVTSRTLAAAIWHQQTTRPSR
jgi:non-specific serine/threonine protein kinase